MLWIGLLTRPRQVVDMGDLAVGELTLDDHDAPARRLDQSGVVGGFSAFGVSRSKHRGPKRLRRLDGDERLARWCVDDHPGAVDALDGVGHGDAGDGAIGTLRNRTDHRCKQLR